MMFIADTQLCGGEGGEGREEGVEREEELETMRQYEPAGLSYLAYVLSKLFW